ncbi:toll/interleukin-1 receptor domain-containing protein [Candidatus Nitrospira neomarina]|uniref:Toll/interleukin-1 receptor domain-containing protein n=1 Tax=Candidatus Nitrospira neomarina TaxID=3020899 RepID=A0AA96K1H9_9BACT|nr:toll/interleukin-1 receptor domain-containing protein [Candidatus Nitrospira neomarina]WNM60689.1 toll/interleukin-1 receptor domain-containing protein [Candidatus Nitrospira neomarina]
MKDVFISYASEDRRVAQQLAASLEQSGVSVWWDRRIQVGSEWDKTIEDALASAKCVVVLWTAHAKDSRWVRAEAREALKTEKVVPVMLEANAIPLAFTGIQALCFLGWEGTAGSKEFDILLSVVRAKLEGKPMELPEASSTKPSLLGKLVALVGVKAGVGGVLAILLIGSSFVRVDPDISVHVETTRMELSVVSTFGDKRLTDDLTFETLTVENIGKLAISPDRLLVADPADYDMESDSYPPKAWFDIPVNGRTVQFGVGSSGMASEIAIEPTDHQEAVAGQLDGIVLTDETFVTMQVSNNNAVTLAFRKKEGPQRVVVSRIHAVQFIQIGLQAPPELSIPFPQDQELTYHIIFEEKPGTMELFGQDEALVLVMKEMDLTGKKPISSSVLPIQSIDFSWQDPGTGERKPPEGFSGTVNYLDPQSMPSVTIGTNAFLTLDDLDHFEITSISIDPFSHKLVVDLKGKAGYVKTGTAGNPQDLRPTLFDHIRYSPLFEPVSKLLGF